MYEGKCDILLLAASITDDDLTSGKAEAVVS